MPSTSRQQPLPAYDTLGSTRFDTHAVARSLTDAELTPAQAHAITAAIRQAAEQGDHVTSDMLDARLAALEPRLVKWTVGTGIAVAGIVIAFLRLMS